MQHDPEGNEHTTLRDILGPSAGVVLEVGCGDGRLTEKLRTVSDRILGLDPDPGSIDKARHLQGNGIRLMLGSGESLPLADNSVDTVVFSLSLHHHPNPENALAQARRVLKEQGRILVLEPAAGSLVNILFTLLHDENEAYDQVAETVKMCGLQLMDLGMYGTIWRYDNFEEMIEHLYSYFDLEPEELKIKAMGNILGSKVKNRPLDIEDSTRWWLLTSPS
jgi:ubiquinone/menaquinone biosynthesis C-methylase UbiE